MKSIIVKLFTQRTERFAEKLEHNYAEGIEYSTKDPREIKSILLGVHFGLFNKNAFREILAGDKILFRQIPAIEPVIKHNAS